MASKTSLCGNCIEECDGNDIRCDFCKKKTTTFRVKIYHMIAYPLSLFPPTPIGVFRAWRGRLDSNTRTNKPQVE